MKRGITLNEKDKAGLLYIPSSSAIQRHKVRFSKIEKTDPQHQITINSDNLGDVNKHSLPNFETMDQNFIRNLAKKNKKGWELVSEIIKKYHNLESVKMTVQRLKEEREQFELDQSLLSKVNLKKKKTTLEDLRFGPHPEENECY